MNDRGIALSYTTSNFSSKRGFPAGNPIANALVIIVGALVIGASIVLGFFAFLILVTVLLVFAAIVGIRLWWFNRKLQKSGREPSAGAGKRPGSGTYIEGEYHVIVKERDGPTSDEKP